MGGKVYYFFCVRPLCCTSWFKYGKHFRERQQLAIIDTIWPSGVSSCIAKQEALKRPLEDKQWGKKKEKRNHAELPRTNTEFTGIMRCLCVHVTWMWSTKHLKIRNKKKGWRLQRCSPVSKWLACKWWWWCMNCPSHRISKATTSHRRLWTVNTDINWG